MPFQGIALGAVIKMNILAEYEKAQASGVSNSVAAKCFKEHFSGVLDLPLQVIADDTKKQRKVLPLVTALLNDEKWWYHKAVIAPVQEVYAEKLLEQIKAANEGNQLEELRKIAQEKLKDDLTIYAAIRLKETHKAGYKELAEHLSELEMSIRKKRDNEKPLQPIPEGSDGILTVAQAKAQAADASHKYKEIINEVKRATGADVQLAPMKGAFRMLQKVGLFLNIPTHSPPQVHMFPYSRSVPASHNLIWSICVCFMAAPSACSSLYV